jgi:Resolvase, N terminal domain
MYLWDIGRASTAESVTTGLARARRGTAGSGLSCTDLSTGLGSRPGVHRQRSLRILRQATTWLPRLLLSARNGELDAVVSWHSDRLHRSPVELEDFIAVCEENELQVVTVQSGQIDLGSPSGRMVARMLGSAARYESEHKSARQRRKALEIAKEGRVSGGGTRAYGFEPDFVTVREGEAAVIRTLAARHGFRATTSLPALGRNGSHTRSGACCARHASTASANTAGRFSAMASGRRSLHRSRRPGSEQSWMTRPGDTDAHHVDTSFRAYSGAIDVTAGCSDARPKMAPAATSA